MKKIKEFLFDDLGIFLVMGAFILLILEICIIVGGTNRTMKIEEAWNRGYCNNCGHEWRYEQAIGHRSSTSYLYVCDDCLNTIEINEYRGE